MPFHAARAGDLVLVAQLQERPMTISKGVYAAGYDAYNFLRRMKTALAELGLCSDTMAPPLVPWDGEARGRIRAAPQSLHLLPGSNV